MAKINNEIDNEISAVFTLVNNLIKSKNHDYNYAFFEDIKEEGKAAVRMMLSHKLNRYKELSRSGESEVGESEKDTLLDIIGYAANAIAYYEMNKISTIKDTMSSFDKLNTELPQVQR